MKERKKNILAIFAADIALISVVTAFLAVIFPQGLDSVENPAIFLFTINIVATLALEFFRGVGYRVRKISHP